MGLHLNQRTSIELQRLGCLLSVFVPFETVAILLNNLTTVQVSCVSVWHWIQRACQKAMDRLHRELDELASGNLPQIETLEEAISFLPLLMGSDGVMVPFRPESGKGSTIWREVKVAVLARLGRRRKSNAPQLYQRRLVAVLGDIDSLSPRLWLEALRQSILTAPQVVSVALAFVVSILITCHLLPLGCWISTMQFGISGKVLKHGLMDAARKRVSGLLYPDTDCGMVRRM